MEDFQRHWLGQVNEMLGFMGASTWLPEDADHYVNSPFIHEPPLPTKRISPWKKIENECRNK